MEYIVVKEGIVTGHFDAVKIPDGDEYKPALKFNGCVGIMYNMLDEEHRVKQEDQLISEGLVKDYRGKYWDKETKELHEIKTLGVEPLENWTKEEPSGMPYEYWNDSSAIWEDDSNEKDQYELSILRGERTREFTLFDKYQLQFLWDNISTEQQNEYLNWRGSWLDVTTTKIKPERPSWFTE